MDYLLGNDEVYLTLHNSYGLPEKMPVALFFREEGDLTPLEHHALKLCKGTVLDIGAGVGAISLILQETRDVTAIDISADACEIARLRGVKKVIQGNIIDCKEGRYDTLLMLMNGIGLVEEVRGLTGFLKHLKSLLSDDGQVVLDSSDLSYLYKELKSDNTLGEIRYQYEYKKKKDPWFNWLYVDQVTLGDHAKAAGFNMRIAHEDNMDQYLAVLTPF